ncbi:MAG TPA: flagellar hook assembly protein FlgD [Micropepsaceae bacterium]|nr:flagellar hook assembly protein FlgD [Micropepsaceae bacterium]
MDAISAASAASQSTAAKDKTKLGTNFDTFLTLLTTQLKNQDPLSPMDSSQFTQQLVQFSQVEQSINANQNLESLISLTKARAGSDAVGFLGKTVTLTDGTAGLKSGQAQWGYSLGSDSASTRLTISDSKGHTVYIGAGDTTSGLHAFSWDGKDNAGNTLPDGAYTLSVKAQTTDGTAIDAAVASQGVVDEVDLSGTEPMLKIGALLVPLSKATLISGH